MSSEYRYSYTINNLKFLSDLYLYILSSNSLPSNF